MKKTINKIMCLVAVLVLCLPMLNLCPVSAEELEEESFLLPSYYGIEYFKPHEDGSGFKLLAEDINSSSYCSGLRNKNYVTYETGALTEEEYHSSYCLENNSSYYSLYPYIAYSYTEGYHLLNVADKYSLFVLSLYQHSIYGNDKIAYSAEEDYYYLTYYYSFQGFSEKQPGYGCCTFLSTEPITFTKNGSSIKINTSQSYCMFTNYYKDKENQLWTWQSDPSYKVSNVTFDENLLPSISSMFSNMQIESAYTNCTTMDLSMFSNTDILNYGMSDLKQDTTTLAEQIDVKLTPEFGLDMDRTFDPLTGQNDYFKFEVTNNSETSIQFCLSIKDRAIDVEKGYEGQVIEDVFQGIGDWEGAYWNYITDTYYYADSVDQIKSVYDDVEDFMNNMAVLVPDVNFFPDDYIRYAELQKGNFYWVLLNPGETYEDYIYWSNVNIEESKSYSFICDVVPTSLEYPTDIFYYVDEETDVFAEATDGTILEDIMSTGTKYYAPNSDLPTSSYHFDIENTTDKYAVKANDCYRICNYVFSVYSVPTFSSTVVGGNSAITSGWNDTISQADNPYYRYNTSTDSMIPVSDYSAFMPGHALGGVTDIDFDNIGINDVKNYIKYSQGYFELLRSVFQVFPAVWVLIVFGLGAIIVIAIIKFIKG